MDWSSVGFSLLPVRRTGNEGSPYTLLERETAQKCLAVAAAGAGCGLPVVGHHASGALMLPSDYLASVTHGHGLAAAILGLKRKPLVSVGVDLEMDVPLDPRCVYAVASGAEVASWPRTGSAESALVWATRCFSAKESIYKCLSPIAGEVKFCDVEIVFGPGSDRFHARLEPRIYGALPAGIALQGRYLASDGIIVTAVAAVNEG